jgi:type VI secretion system protein ImpL
LRGVLQEFLEVTFSSSPYEADALLRGVYFVSGTQEGTPIDRVLGSIARSYRLERAIIAPNQASGRSYFLPRLLGEVVFAESGLANTDLKWERRRTGAVVAGYAAIALLTVGAIAAWLVSYVNNRRYVDDVAQRVAQVWTAGPDDTQPASPDLLPIMTGARSDEQPRWQERRSVTQARLRSLPGSEAGQRRARQLPAHARRRDAAPHRPARRRAAPPGEQRHRDAIRGAQDVSHAARRAALDPDALKRYLANDWDLLFGRSLTAEERDQLDAPRRAARAKAAIAAA